MLLMPTTRDYRIIMPTDRWVQAACEDAGCDNWRYGWDTILDVRKPDHAQMAEVIRAGRTGRTFRELSAPDGVAVFRFEPRQRCFAEHKTRPGRLLVTQGRQIVRQHAYLSDMAEDYTDHNGRLADQAQKG